MKQSDSLGFEEALDRLEQLVTQLEGGSLTLEDSLGAFERGVHLVRQCGERLRQAELRIQQLEQGPEGLNEHPADLPEES